MIRMSLVKIDKYVIDKSFPKSCGILPDIEIPFNVQDLTEGKDSQLDYMVKQISMK